MLFRLFKKISFSKKYTNIARIAITKNKENGCDYALQGANEYRLSVGIVKGGFTDSGAFSIALQPLTIPTLSQECHYAL